MNIKFIFLLLVSVISLNYLSANDKKSNYNEFANDYANLFGEKPSNVWNSNIDNCSICTSNCATDCQACRTGNCSGY